jgi:hemerythrin
MLSEHFAAEERMMSTRGWSRLEHHVARHQGILAQARQLEHLVVRNGLTHELVSLAMKHLPEMLRFHEMASDFGFGKFALGVAEDPGRRFARRVAGG